MMIIGFIQDGGFIPFFSELNVTWLITIFSKRSIFILAGTGTEAFSSSASGLVKTKQGSRIIQLNLDGIISVH